MNLVTFLNKTDAIVRDLSREQLTSLVHENARVLPPAKREDFLQKLERIATSTSVSSLANPLEKEDADLDSKITSIIQKLDAIDKGKRSLSSEYNEMWDDWYGNEEDEFVFLDPEGLLQDIKQAIDLVHECVDTENYSKGYDLANKLSQLCINITGDYDDCVGDPFDVNNLFEYDLLPGKLNDVVLESLFLAYMGNNPEDQAKEISAMIGNYRFYDVSLEELMQSGFGDLPDFDIFLPSWIDCLGAQKGLWINKLLAEAISLLSDQKQQIEFAERFVADHPELYKQILQNNEFGADDYRMIEIGKAAMEKIPDSFTIRSEIALYTAKYACKVNDLPLAESCWLEAFHSDSTATNFLRFRMLAKNWESKSEELKSIYEKAYKAANIPKESPCSSRFNSLEDTSYYRLLFFDGRLDAAFRFGMNKSEALGWSYSFMKEGMALFLAALYQGEHLPSGISAMFHRIIQSCGFSIAQYTSGTTISAEGDNTEFFIHLFEQWKSHLIISDADYENYIRQIEEKMEMRTEGIMQANRRNYYGECASYIAAIGEVRESRGEVAAKAKIMEYYKTKYSRRSAFHRELRSFGMK